MTDTTSLRREALIEGGSSRERARLTVWSEDNPRDQLALVAICAWLNVKPDQLPSAWHGHTCEATKEAWARVAEAIKSELEADLARVTAERDAERAVAEIVEYVLQDDLHNRLTPRVVDIAYSAFMAAKCPNSEDGGPSDWFTDTKPMVMRKIAEIRAAYAKHKEGRK